MGAKRNMQILQTFILLLMIIYGIVIIFYTYKIDDDLQSVSTCTNTTIKTCIKILLSIVPSVLILTLFFIGFIWRNQSNYIIIMILCCIIIITYTTLISIIKKNISEDIKNTTCIAGNVTKYVNIIFGMTISYLIIFIILTILFITNQSIKDFNIGYDKEYEVEKKTNIQAELECANSTKEKNELKAKLDAATTEVEKANKECTKKINKAIQFTAITTNNSSNQQPSSTPTFIMSSPQQPQTPQPPSVDPVNRFNSFFS